ncbi:MAG TPA: RNA methyltransferase [Candidatus Pelethenecus sp.]|jgi:rRNA methylases|nr:RNA methyltransferase [Candidatus Pelethenecus sp.]
MITSVENSKVKEISKLKLAKYRKSEQKFIVEGSHLVEEARNANVLLEAFSIEEKQGYTTLSPVVMKKICNTDTVVKEIGICKMENKTNLCSRILILDGIQDPGNMGTLMRSANAFGFKTLFIGNGCVDIYNDKVIRSSQGAIFKLNFLFGNVLEFLLNLKDYKIYGTNVVRGISLDKVKRFNKMAIVLGNEGNGISKEVEELSLDNIYISMENTESLNVAVAGSIIMYELK